MKYKIISSRIFFSLIKFFNFLAFFSKKFENLLHIYWYKKKSKKNKIKEYSVSVDNYFFFFISAKICHIKIFNSKIFSSVENDKKKEKNPNFYSLNQGLKKHWVTKKRRLWFQSQHPIVNIGSFVKFMNLKKDLSFLNEICKLYNFSKIGINPEILQFIFKIYNKEKFKLNLQDSLSFLAKNWFLEKINWQKDSIFSDLKFFFLFFNKKIKINHQLKYFIGNIQINLPVYTEFKNSSNVKLHSLKIFYILLKFFRKLSLIPKHLFQILNCKVLNVNLKNKKLFSTKILFLKKQFYLFFFFFTQLISKNPFKKKKMTFLFYNNILGFLKLTKKKLGKIFGKKTLSIEKIISETPFINLNFLKSFHEIFPLKNFLHEKFQKILVFNKDQPVFRKEFEPLVRIYNVSDFTKPELELEGLNIIVFSFFFQKISIFLKKFSIKFFYFRIDEFEEKIFKEKNFQKTFDMIFENNFSTLDRKMKKSFSSYFLLKNYFNFNFEKPNQISLYFIKIEEIFFNFLLNLISLKISITPLKLKKFYGLFRTKLKNRVIFFFQPFNFLIFGHFFNKYCKNFHFSSPLNLEYFFNVYYFYQDIETVKIYYIFSEKYVFNNFLNYKIYQKLQKLESFGINFKTSIIDKITNIFFKHSLNLKKRFLFIMYLIKMEKFFLDLNSISKNFKLKKLKREKVKSYILNEYQLNNFLIHGNRKKI